AAIRICSVRAFPIGLDESRERNDAVAAIEVHELDTLRAAADHVHVARVHADDLSLLGHEEHVVPIGDARDADHRTVAIARLHVLQADAAAGLPAVFRLL